MPGIKIVSPTTIVSPTVGALLIVYQSKQKPRPGLHERRRPSADRSPVYPFMWTTGENLVSDRPSHAR